MNLLIVLAAQQVTKMKTRKEKKTNKRKYSDHPTDVQVWVIVCIQVIALQFRLTFEVVGVRKPLF